MVLVMMEVIMEVKMVKMTAEAMFVAKLLVVMMLVVEVVVFAVMIVECG